MRVFSSLGLLLTRNDILNLQWRSIERVIRVTKEMGADSGPVDGSLGCWKDDGINHHGVHEWI